MRSDYTELDTERVRAVERASAHGQTQPLSPPRERAVALQPARGGISTLAVALIAIGILMLARSWFGGFGIVGALLPAAIVPSPGALQGGMVLLTIASCFLFFAFWRRIYLLAIPGCITAGLSLGVAFADITKGVSIMWGLALGFLAIRLLDRAMFRIRSPWAVWPIYPAIPLFAVGVLIALAHVPVLSTGGLGIIPALLIGGGLYLGWRRNAF